MILFQTKSGVKLEVRDDYLYTTDEKAIREALEEDLKSSDEKAVRLAEAICKLIAEEGIVAEAQQFELKWVEKGQRYPYSDTYYTCEIHTDAELTDEEILCITEEKGRLPYEEWKKRSSSFSDYFKGYYTIEKTNYGYLYKGVYPYDD